MHFWQLDVAKVDATLWNESVTNGISSTPCLIHTKGNKPVMHNKNILNDSKIE